jgi:hypothetical protein
LLNKVSFIVQRIANDLDLIRPNRQIKKAKDANKALSWTSDTIEKAPEIWQENMNTLNKLPEIQLITLQLILSVRTDLLHLHHGINEKTNHLLLKHYHKLIKLLDSDNADEMVTHLKATLDHLNTEKFIFLVKDLIKVITDDMKSRSKSLPRSLPIIKFDVYENFKEEQFSKRKPNSLQLRSMATQTIKDDYLKPVQLLVEELAKNLEISIEKVHESISKYILILESGQAVADRGYDIERYKDEVKELLATERTLVEKLLTKVLNQIMERRNSLVDKFSILTILRAKGNIRKYLR